MKKDVALERPRIHTKTLIVDMKGRVDNWDLKTKKEKIFTIKLLFGRQIAVKLFIKDSNN